MDSYFSNVGGDAVAVAKSGSGGLGGYSEIIKVAVDLGVQYLYAKKENKRNQELLKSLSDLD